LIAEHARWAIDQIRQRVSGQVSESNAGLPIVKTG
jgi:hypothetical protein